MKKYIIVLLIGLVFATGLFAQSPSTVETEEAVTLKTTRETWRIQADVSPSGEAVLEVLRRDRQSVAGVTIGQPSNAPTVRRSLSTSATDSVTLTNRKEISLAEVFEAFARLTAGWEAEDAAALAAAEEEEGGDPE